MQRLQSTPDLFSSLLDGLEKDQPAIINWIFSVAVMEEFSIENMINPKTIEEAEEKNWTILSEQKVKSFREKINVFFDGYPQEDLLAFAEDALEMEHEDQVVTTIGRPPIFIALKTLIDVLAIGKPSEG